MADARIFFVGTGGQGTLTATRLLAQAALMAGLEVVAGEVHGMAQRGGVVESTLLIGGWRAARLDRGEADILLGFEALETLRALPWLKAGGVVFSSTQTLPPLSVALGEFAYPPLEDIKTTVAERAAASFFLPCHALGLEAGAAKSGNSALLGAVVASPYLPLTLADLAAAMEVALPPKLCPSNLKAMELGAQWYGGSS